MESKETLASTVILFLQAGEVKSGAKGEGRRGNAVERESDCDSEKGTFCFPAAPELRMAQPDRPPVFSPPSKPCVRQKGCCRPHQCLSGGSLDSTAPSTLLSTSGHVVYASELTRT